MIMIPTATSNHPKILRDRAPTPASFSRRLPNIPREA